MTDGQRPGRRFSIAGGHFRTLRGHLVRRLRPPRHRGAQPWATTLADPDVGSIRLTGRLKEIPGASAVVIVVHGLGGCSESAYSLGAANAADRAGISSLRLSLRGADRRGEDFYHAGLTADLGAAAASRELQRYPHLLVLGYSLGGHLALRFAVDGAEPRLRAVAAVCSPLGLSTSADALDRPSRWLYRHHALSSLKEIYRAVAQRGSVPSPLAAIASIRSLREMDGATVALRYGFVDAEDYYRRASVGPLLSDLAVPALIVATEDDPVVPPESIRPWAEGASPSLELRWLSRGGHLGFSPSLDLGMAAPTGLENQLLAWLESKLPIAGP